MRAARVFFASFVVLFLEVALIRWLPAQIRLLAYFSNFVLLASFLGIGLGCLLAGIRADLFRLFPALASIVVGAVSLLRLEVRAAASSEIFFSSGTAEKVVAVESFVLLPLLFVAVAALFTALAQRMGREMARLPSLWAYTVNILGSLAGIAGFCALAWLELGPAVWFATAFGFALPLLVGGRRAVAAINVLLLAGSIAVVGYLSKGSIWSPYYRIDLYEERGETALEVNHVFHQSMAPLERKEYFYEWPYTVFGDAFDDVLVLGAGTGTDVAAALRHGARRVDAVEIDPAILRLGAERHPDRPYADPRVRAICDDARHFLATTGKKYDLVVFGLIDSLTLQSGFAAIRLESYMFTEEAFRAVRARLKPGGLLVIYNYFRERWLVDRLANTAARVFGSEPHVHVHERSSALGVLMAGPRLDALPAAPPIPEYVAAFGHRREASPGHMLRRDETVAVATDDWPFLYMRERHLPGHYLASLGGVLAISALSVFGVLRGKPGRWSWHFFFLGAGFMLLETKSIIQFALLWGSTWVVASLVIGAILVMALAANLVVALCEIRRPGLVTAVLLALLGTGFLLPIGALALQSRALESAVQSLLTFSPIFCAGIIFGSSIKTSRSIALDYGANLLGAMVGGVAEYLCLVTGHWVLLFAVALFYAAAWAVRRREGAKVARDSSLGRTLETDPD